ncbi:MAG TPA: hypothetical protein ENH19_00530 [Actinobacteria bacterium]|nr:hypothetical protein [Actinomycetes bacterium]HEX21121.1 hypothetical protein [Actinomycetota bacterium]
MYEVYIEYGHPFIRFDQYAKMAKTEGILNKSIFAISIVTVDNISTENQLRYIRELAPSMPGKYKVFARLTPKPLLNYRQTHTTIKVK